MMSRRPQKGPRQPKTARKPFCGRFFRLLAAAGGKGQGKFENKKKNFDGSQKKYCNSRQMGV